MHKFSKDHEWVRVDGDTATIGITRHATEQLGDVVFVEVPEVGRKVTAGESCAVVESVKAASDVFAPVSGEVIAANAAIADTPASVNEDPEGNGWFFKLKLANALELSALITTSSSRTTRDARSPDYSHPQPHNAWQTFHRLRWVRTQCRVQPVSQTLTIIDCCGAGLLTGWAAKAAGATQTMAASAKIFRI